MIRCPVHGIPDCSPLLNGCSVPNLLRDAYDQGAHEARSELEPAIDAVRRLHTQDDSHLAPGKWCPSCGHETPCPTIRALNETGATR